jgi:nucleoid DNA-binding protein
LVDKELKFIFTKMDILQYLIKLVENQKEVGVSGLGTFYKKKSPGRYDVNIHSFIPPSLVLHFKQEVTEDDILADYISKERNISRSSAHYFIKQFSEDINKQLEVNKQVVLGSLGALIAKDGIITLSLGGNSEAGNDFYGLPLIQEDTKVRPVDSLEDVQSSEHTKSLDNDHSVERAKSVEDVQSSENIQVSKNTQFPENVHSSENIKSLEDVQSLEMTKSLENGQSLEDDKFLTTESAPNDQPTGSLVKSEDHLQTQSIEDLSQAKSPSDIEHKNQSVSSLDDDSNFLVTENYFNDPVTVPDVDPEKVDQASNTSIQADQDDLDSQAKQLKETNTKDAYLASIVEENSLEEANPGTATSYLPPINRVNDMGPLSLEKERNEFPLYLKVILAILVLVVAFFAFYFLYPNTINNFNKSSDRVDQSSLKAPIEQKNAKLEVDSSLKDTVTKPIIPDTAASVKIDSTLKLPTTSLPPVSKIDSVQTTYEVIGSSPYRLSEAEQFIHIMKVKHGLYAKIVSQKKGKKIKISVATFKTKKQADLEVPILIKKLGIKGLYTYTNTHKPN